MTKLKTIKITICEECLDGVGGECHTPGCALWLHHLDVLRIEPVLYEVLDEFEAIGATGQVSDASR